MQAATAAAVDEDRLAAESLETAAVGDLAQHVVALEGGQAAAEARDPTNLNSSHPNETDNDSIQNKHIGNDIGNDIGNPVSNEVDVTHLASSDNIGDNENLNPQVNNAEKSEKVGKEVEKAINITESKKSEKDDDSSNNTVKPTENKNINGPAAPPLVVAEEEASKSQSGQYIKKTYLYIYLEKNSKTTATKKGQLLFRRIFPLILGWFWPFYVVF